MRTPWGVEHRPEPPCTATLYMCYVHMYTARPRWLHVWHMQVRCAPSTDSQLVVFSEVLFKGQDVSQDADDHSSRSTPPQPRKAPSANGGGSRTVGTAGKRRRVSRVAPTVRCQVHVRG